MIAPTRASHSRLSARMRDALADLTITQRQALYLTVVDGRPATNVGRHLDLPAELAEQIAVAARTKIYEAVAR